MGSYKNLLSIIIIIIIVIKLCLVLGNYFQVSLHIMPSVIRTTPGFRIKKIYIILALLSINYEYCTTLILKLFSR